MPSIDVVIPTYNCREFVCEAIDSVLAQTLQPNKIHVVDDGSTDDTKKLITKRYKKLKQVIYHHQKNQGLSAARNTGINNSQSEHLAFLDSDDTWEPTKLEKQFQVFKITKYKQLGLVYCGYDLINEKGEKIDTHTYTLDRQVKGNVYDILARRNQIAGSGSAVLIKRECFEKVGLFDTDLTAAEDWDMWLRISHKYQVEYVDEVLVHLRRHNQNMQTNHAKIFENLVNVYQKHSIEHMIDERGISNLQLLLFKNSFQNKLNLLSSIKLLRSMNRSTRKAVFKDKIGAIRNLINFSVSLFLEKKSL